jgi:hypothetical protein
MREWVTENLPMLARKIVKYCQLYEFVEYGFENIECGYDNMRPTKNNLYIVSLNVDLGILKVVY